MQSFKTFAASRTFQSTMIFRQRYQFEDLLVAFLRTLARHAGAGLDLAAARVTIGRPVRFAGASSDDALAMQRYRDAFGRLGAGHSRYVYEPVGAAFSFARSLDRDATVLVADFGGGTSDFSIVRFSRTAGGLRAEPLGHAGIGIAGDTFDARIVDRVVSPRLGKGGRYRSFGKVLPLPRHYYARLARWNELSLMKGSADLGELRELARFALDPAPLRDFIALVEFDLASRSTARSRRPKSRCRPVTQSNFNSSKAMSIFARQSPAPISKAGSARIWRGSPRQSIRSCVRPRSHHASWTRYS